MSRRWPALHSHYEAFRSLTVERKSETLNLRVTPELKKLVRLAADKERRTLSSFLEVLVRQYCSEHSVKVGKKTARGR